MKKLLVGIVAVLVVGLVVLGILMAGPGGEPARADGEATRDSGTGVVGGPAAPGEAAEMDPDAVVREDVVYTPRDVEIFDETMAWAREQRLDTLGIGAMMTQLGRRFVGAPYTPGTLDPPGDEKLIVNLREYDCVTYVESVLAMARVIRSGTPTFPAFTQELRRIRYRSGEMDGYMSRLHYFSEWIHDNASKRIVRDVTTELGGVTDPGPINFMSSNADLYSHLKGQPARIQAIRAIEQRLTARPRAYIPEARIADVAERIRDGDILAATSNRDGLDVAHTGLALWIDGRLHMMHAPLVGKAVEISSRPLAARIVRIEGQDGIMVARPL